MKTVNNLFFKALSNAIIGAGIVACIGIMVWYDVRDMLVGHPLDRQRE